MGTVESIPAIDHAGLPLRPDGWPCNRDDLTAVLSALPAAVLTTDRACRITFANPTAAAMFGYEPGDLVGREIEVLLPPDRREPHRGHRAAAGPIVERVHGERLSLTGWTSDGRAFPVDVGLSTLHVGGQRVVVCLITDVTERVRAQEQAVASERRFRALIEESSDAIHVIDERMRIRYASPAVETMFGYSVDEVLGRSVMEWIHPDDVGNAVARFTEAVDGHRKTDRVELRIRHKDGTWRWVETIGRDLRHDPVIGGVILNTRDITDRKHAEEALDESEQRLHALFDDAHVGVSFVDRDGTIMWVNDAYARMHHGTAQDLVGRGVADLIHPENRPPELPIENADLISGRIPHLEKEQRHLCLDGAVFDALVSISVVRDAAGRPRYMMDLIQDITARKRVEEETRRALEVEQAAVERLQALDQLKNAFLTAVSHELRTPLASILGSALTLDRSDIELSETDRCGLVHAVATNSRKLDRLLTDLLDLDRLTRGILEPARERTDVGTLARRVVVSSDALDDHPVDLDLDPVVVWVDAAKVERILENLVVNAARHTPAGTPVRLAVHGEDGGVSIVVEDSGPGVEDELKESIFEPFRRGADQPCAPGVGVGLSLVAKFAELHGGRAWVEDRPGGGASFHVFLPDAEPGSLPEDPSASDRG